MELLIDIDMLARIPALDHPSRYRCPQRANRQEQGGQDLRLWSQCHRNQQEGTRSQEGQHRRQILLVV